MSSCLWRIPSKTQSVKQHRHTIQHVCKQCKRFQRCFTLPTVREFPLSVARPEIVCQTRDESFCEFRPLRHFNISARRSELWFLLSRELVPYTMGRRISFFSSSSRSLPSSCSETFFLPSSSFVFSLFRDSYKPKKDDRSISSFFSLFFRSLWLCYCHVLSSIKLERIGKLFSITEETTWSHLSLPRCVLFLLLALWLSSCLFLLR